MRVSPGGQRPAVHRRADAGPGMDGLIERYGSRWDIFAVEGGELLAVPRPRVPGVSWVMVVSAWELAGFGDRLAEADRAMREDR